jgi:hypothetical protein
MKELVFALQFKVSRTFRWDYWEGPTATTLLPERPAPGVSRKTFS